MDSKVEPGAQGVADNDPYETAVRIVASAAGAQAEAAIRSGHCGFTRQQIIALARQSAERIRAAFAPKPGLFDLAPSESDAGTACESVAGASSPAPAGLLLLTNPDNGGCEQEQPREAGMNPSLNEISQRLAAVVGLPISLDARSAAQLKETAPRERLLRALDRAEHSNDTGARAYLDRVLSEAGLLPAANTQPQLDPEPQPQPQPQRVPNAPARETDQLSRSSESSANAAPRANAPRAARPSFHVYGGKAALTFELDETTAGVPTVALDATHSVGERQYDWSAKVRIQLTARELPVVAAVLLGILPECTFQNHGPANDKGFSIAWQSERQTFFVKAWQGKGNLRAVPMPREDGFYVAQILLRAIQQGSPARLDTAGTIATLRAFFGRV